MHKQISTLIVFIDILATQDRYVHCFAIHSIYGIAIATPFDICFCAVARSIRKIIIIFRRNIYVRTFQMEQH